MHGCDTDGERNGERGDGSEEGWERWREGKACGEREITRRGSGGRIYIYIVKHQINQVIHEDPHNKWNAHMDFNMFNYRTGLKYMMFSSRMNKHI